MRKICAILIIAVALCLTGCRAESVGVINGGAPAGTAESTGNNISGGYEAASTESRFDPGKTDGVYVSPEAEYTAEPSGDVPAAAQRSDAAEDTEIFESSVNTEDSASTGGAESGAASSAPEQIHSEAEPQNSCTLLVSCERALGSGKLSDSMLSVLPKDGILLQGRFEFTPGESVYDLLSRELKSHNIPMEASYTPGLGSTYIEGINSLYETDCGEQSGWVYFVNGAMPNVGCDKTLINSGDDVRWYYTLDMGHDIEL